MSCGWDDFAGWLHARASNGSHVNPFQVHPVRCGGGVRSRFLCCLPLERYSCGLLDIAHPVLLSGVLGGYKAVHVLHVSLHS
jgi:hypothetical protein